MILDDNSTKEGKQGDVIGRDYGQGNMQRG